MIDYEARIRGLEARVALLEEQQASTKNKTESTFDDHRAYEKCRKCHLSMLAWTVTCPRCGHFNSGNL